MAIRIGNFTPDESFRCSQPLESTSFDKIASQALFIAEIASGQKIVDQVDPQDSETRAKIPTFAPRHYELSEVETRAKTMTTYQIAEAVHPHGEWDYKRGGRTELDDFGNWNYGVAGKAWSTQFHPFSYIFDEAFEDLALRVAGYVQVYVTHTSEPEWDQPWGSPPYGDDPDDQPHIMNGWDFENSRLNQPSGDAGVQDSEHFDENPQDFEQPDIE